MHPIYCIRALSHPNSIASELYCTRFIASELYCTQFIASELCVTSRTPCCATRRRACRPRARLERPPPLSPPRHVRCRRQPPAAAGAGGPPAAEPWSRGDAEPLSRGATMQCSECQAHVVTLVSSPRHWQVTGVYIRLHSESQLAIDSERRRAEAVRPKSQLYPAY